MTTDSQLPRLERVLAYLLQIGTAISSTIIAVGLLAIVAGVDASIDPPGMDARVDLMTIGIASFILLPVLRVVVMLVTYLTHRDVLMAAISTAVLAIIMVGLVVGLVMFNPPL